MVSKVEMPPQLRYISGAGIFGAMMRYIFFILIIMTGGAVAQSQTANDYQQRQNDLIELASVFGELHHIRRICEPRLESDIWRERMKKLVDLEQPQHDAREEMVQRFNAGYRNAGDHFPRCSTRARDHAAARALFARRLVERLSAPLRETAQEDGPLLLTIPQDAE